MLMQQGACLDQRKESFLFTTVMYGSGRELDPLGERNHHRPYFQQALQVAVGGHDLRAGAIFAQVGWRGLQPSLCGQDAFRLLGRFIYRQLVTATE